MAIIQQRLPLYYATLQNEYGLTFTDIQQLDKANRVYVLEMGKADAMKEKGYSNTQILDYFKKQGYSTVQTSSVETYLVSRNKTDASGSTEKNKLDKTISDIQKVSSTVLPIWESLAKSFGIGGNSLSTPNYIIPDLTNLKQVTTDGFSTFTIDTSKGQIMDSKDVEISAPKIGVSSLPFGLTTETFFIILILTLAVVYLFAKSPSDQKRKK